MENVDHSKTLYRMQVVAFALSALALFSMANPVLPQILGLLSISLGIGRAFFIKNKNAAIALFAFTSLCWALQFVILAYSMR